MSFQINNNENLEVELPALRNDHVENEKKSIRNKSMLRSKRIMSPLVLNRTELRLKEPDDSALKYDEEKYLIYSVFRQKILDNTMRSLTKEMIEQTVREFKANPNIARKKLKSIVSGRVDPVFESKLKYNPANLKLLKLRHLVNKDYDNQK